MYGFSIAVLLFSTTVVPLTVDNVVEAVDRVKTSWQRLGRWLYIPHSNLVEFESKHSSIEGRLKSTIHLWLLTDPYASWRRIIQALDGIKEHKLAGSLCHLAEPIVGMFSPRIDSSIYGLSNAETSTVSKLGGSWKTAMVWNQTGIDPYPNAMIFCVYFTSPDFVSAYSITNKRSQQLNILIYGSSIMNMVIRNKCIIDVEPMKHK